MKMVSCMVLLYDVIVRCHRMTGLVPQSCAITTLSRLRLMIAGREFPPHERRVAVTDTIRNVRNFFPPVRDHNR